MWGFLLGHSLIMIQYKVTALFGILIFILYICDIKFIIMEALLALTLFGSIIWFWMSVLVFLIICFISEIEENGFLAFGTLVLIIIAYNVWGDIKAILPLFSFVTVSIYLVIGLVFSILRTFFMGRTLGKKIKNLIKSNEELRIANPRYAYDDGTSIKGLRKPFIDDLKGNVFRWWFMWPVSMITWLITDLIKDMWDYVYSKIKNFYNYLLELGIKSV